MNITLEDGTPIRGDLVFSAVLRSDLTPVPMTLEASLRLDDDLLPLVSEGRVIEAGSHGVKFRIVKTVEDGQSTGVQGDRPAGTVNITALMNACHTVAFRRQSAIIKEGTTIGGIYRSCGSQVSIDSDFPIPRFACLAGEVPSIGVARVLQEEGGALVYSGGDRLRFVRLPDLFTQKPVDRVAVDNTEDLTSGFLERHEVPAFYSVSPSGGVVFGNRTKTRDLRYWPRSDARTLRNMTRVIVQKKTLRNQFAGHIKAGDVIAVADVPYVVVTAAHVHESGTDDGAANSYSKLWLGSLEE